MKLSKYDSDRILENFKTSFAHQLENEEWMLALKLTGITFRDVWLCSLEYSLNKKREKLSKRIDAYNFETATRTDIREL